MPCVRCPPCASDRPRMVSPGLISACMAAALACAPECGCTLAIAGTEQRLDPVDRQRLDDVDVLAAAVVAAARVTLGVLVGQHAALGLHRGHRGEVLRGDHLQRVLLATDLAADVLGDLRVGDLQRGVQSGPRRSRLRCRLRYRGAGGAVAAAATSVVMTGVLPRFAPDGRSFRRVVTRLSRTSTVVGGAVNADIGAAEFVTGEPSQVSHEQWRDRVAVTRVGRPRRCAAVGDSSTRSRRLGGGRRLAPYAGNVRVFCARCACM